MKKYGKLINNVLEYAPKNKGSILNYNLDEDRMIQDGYKEVIEPSIPDYQYTVKYEESETLITIKYVKIEDNHDYSKDREDLFKSQFIQTSKGWFRLQPKGFANAQQAIDFADRRIEKAGAITNEIANQIIFYKAPDFTKEEECTEEWLVANQTTWNSTKMEDWNAFYIEFGNLYILSQYK